jgi:protein SDA1
MQVFLMKPIKQNKQLADSMLFLANISHCFQDELKEYPKQLIDLLRKYSNVLNPEMRMAVCRALILIRNKNLIEPIPIFELFFFLFKCNDKLLRTTIYSQLISDVKKIKMKYKNYKLISQQQQYVFSLVKDSNPAIAKYALVSQLFFPLSFNY